MFWPRCQQPTTGTPFGPRTPSYCVPHQNVRIPRASPALPQPGAGAAPASAQAKSGRCASAVCAECGGAGGAFEAGGAVEGEEGGAGAATLAALGEVSWGAALGVKLGG